MMNPIVEALKQLDPTSDNNWTAEGLPRLDTMKFLSGDQALTREDVTNAAPSFNRSNLVYDAPPPAAEATPPADLPTGVMQPDAVEDAAPKPVVDLTESHAALAKVREALAEMRTKVDQTKSEILKAEAYEQEVADYIDNNTPPVPSTMAVQGYLAQQKKNLEERATRKQALKESGVDMKDLKDLAGGLKAPIDTALGNRKRNRPGT